MSAAAAEAIILDDGDVLIAYGNARPTDTHLLATVHCMDDEIVAWLERRERRRKTRKTSAFSEPRLQSRLLFSRF
jgi:hypothetical protein